MKSLVMLAGLAGSVVLGGSATAATAAAADAPASDSGPFSLQVKAGGFYDDNVTVDAQDLATHQGDHAAMIDASAGVKLGPAKGLHAAANYDFYQTLHKNLSQYDLQIHDLSLTVGDNLGGVDVASDFRFDHILLGGHNFLNMSSVRPNIGYSIGPVYLTAAYEYQYRNFATAYDARDAKHNEGALMAYFVPAPGMVLNAGYSLVHEVASDPQFDFWGHYLDAGVKAKLPLLVLNPTFRLNYQYYTKDFSNITPSIGDIRNDKRHDVKTSLEVPVALGFSATAQYEYVHSTSNLPILNYNEHVITLMLGWKL